MRTAFLEIDANEVFYHVHIFIFVMIVGIILLSVVINKSEEKDNYKSEEKDNYKILGKKKVMYSDIYEFYNRPIIIGRGHDMVFAYNNNIFSKCFVLIDNYRYKVKEIWNNGKFIIVPNINVPIIYKEHSLYIKQNLFGKKIFYGILVDSKVIDKVIFEKYGYNKVTKTTKTTKNNKVIKIENNKITKRMEMIEVKELNVEDVFNHKNNIGFSQE